MIHSRTIQIIIREEDGKSGPLEPQSSVGLRFDFNGEAFGDFRQIDSAIMSDHEIMGAVMDMLPGVLQEQRTMVKERISHE